jgi:hypothetical protein
MVGVAAIAGMGASKGRRRLLSWQEWRRMGGAGIKVASGVGVGGGAR